MKLQTHIRAFAGLVLSTATLLAGGMLVAAAGPRAQAAPSYAEYQRKRAARDSLRSQLSGVSGDLQRQIEQLSDLTDNQIPAAQAAADKADDAADAAKAQADAAAVRLRAAQKDERDLERQIKQTGADYDDAKAAVAQVARDSFHGSDASKTMELLTESKTTGQFIDTLQSDAAVTRSESEAADEAATKLNTSLNRRQRLQAIEKEVAELKSQADSQAAAAKRAATAAEAKHRQLGQMRDQGNDRRAALQAKQGQLKTAAAKEAADVVLIKSQIDSYNERLERQRQAAQAANVARSNAAGQYTPSAASSTTSSASSSAGSSASSTRSSSAGVSSSRRSSSPSSSVSSSGGASGMNYAVPGSCTPNSTFCYGHRTGNVPGVWGSAYPWSQCTWWAYIRRQQLRLPVGSYLGNGQDWAGSAAALGYLVNHTPHVGAVISFRGGQLGHSLQYGHVGVVEHMNSDGSILISESGSIWHGGVHWATIQNPGLYWYVHY